MRPTSISEPPPFTCSAMRWVRLQSLCGAIAIHYTGWLAIDPILSILIAALIVWSAIDIIRESLNILLEGLATRAATCNPYVRAMREVPGVLDVHDVHVWSLGSSAHALSCHALIEDMPPSESDCILQGLNEVLGDRFHIHHTTDPVRAHAMRAFGNRVQYPLR